MMCSLTTTAFKDDAWLAHNVLSKYNVLEYFSRSPFYRPPRSASEAYVMVEEQEPHLYVVQKQGRDPATGRAKGAAVYYVLDGTVFQAATLDAVLGGRSGRLLYSLRGAFGEARALYSEPSQSSPGGLAAPEEKAEHERAADRLLSNFFNPSKGQK
mmetsp:Transcript_2825/g.7746  ORF Transcript_2825/g.7746 Transcript_2825/m.7746 type:complete len:156 (-) Transcript_2825:50-517(-)